MAVTLKDISKETGINTCSISQVLNNHPKAKTLRQETRQRILEAAKKLGYSKNQMAAAIAKKHGTVLAFVHSDMGLVEYTGRIQNGVIEAANERGYTITVHHIGNSPEELFRKLMGWRVAGVIFHVDRLKAIEEISKMLEREDIPFGTANLSNPGGIGVTTDDAAGIREAVRCFRETGHRKIAFSFFGKTREITPVEFRARRYFGFEEGLRECFPSCRAPLLLPVDFDRIGVLDYMKEIVEELRKRKVDGVVCESDILAAALNNAAYRCGCRIPEVFSLIGFGGSIISQLSYPAIATVSQDFERMGSISAKTVIDSIEKKNLRKNRDLLLPVSLVMRESIGKR